MIQIDRTSSTSVHEQLIEQLRYQIVSGKYKVNERLPSTRLLADQLGISFHTVRKAYQELEAEGLLESRKGSGFRVREQVPLSKGERMERGAAIVQEDLQRLVGLGLKETEIEYLFDEQMSLLEGAREGAKLVFAAPYQEQADLCAEQITMVLQQAVEPTTLDRLERHQDADYVFTPYANLRKAMEILPRSDVHGVVTHPTLEALEKIARLLDHETLGLIVRYAGTIPHLTTELRAATGFTGQILAASIEDGTRHVAPVIEQTDLVAYTPPSRRRLLTFLKEHQENVVVAPVVSRGSVEALRLRIPS